MSLIAKFRYIDVYYGEVLEPFFESVGDEYSANSRIGNDQKIKNRVGTRAKLTLYDASISTLDVYYLRFGIYLLSFILRFFL